MAVTITCSACHSRFRVQPKSVEQSVPCPVCDHPAVVAAHTKSASNPSATAQGRRSPARPGASKKGSGGTPSAQATADADDQDAAPGLAFIEAMLFYGMFFFTIVILVVVFYWMLVLEFMNLSPAYAERTTGPYFDSEGLPYWNVVTRLGIFSRGVWWTCRVVGTLFGIGALIAVLTNGIALLRGQTELPTQAMPYAFAMCQTLGIGEKTRQSRTNILLFSLFLALPTPLFWLVMPSAETGARWALTRQGFQSPVETIPWQDIQQIDLRHFSGFEKSAPGHVKSAGTTTNTLRIELATITGKKEIVSPYGMGTRYRARMAGDPGPLNPESVRLWSETIAKVAPHVLVRSDLDYEATRKLLQKEEKVKKGEKVKKEEQADVPRFQEIHTPRA